MSRWRRLWEGKVRPRSLVSWTMVSVLAVACISFAPNAYAQRHRGHGVYVRAGIASPWSYYYGPFFDPFWYPYPIYFPPYGWYGFGQGVTSAVRIQVTPRDAKVYVDGYYAGVVDDFDGTFQRLRLPPGKHEIRLFLPGYHSITETVYLSPESTYNMKGELTRLGAGEPEETPPVPPAQPPPVQASPMPPPTEPLPGQEGGVTAMPPQAMPREPEPPAPSSASRFGQLVIRVQPSGAEVYIDGERWLTPDTADRMVVNVAEGRHHIEIHKAGYDSFSTEIDVQRGETTPLNVSLPQRGH